MKSSLIILFFMFLGIILGYFGIYPEFVLDGNMSLYVLYVLLFLVGIGLGFDLKALLVIREMKLNILLVPLGIVIGGLGFGAITGLLLGYGIVEGLVVASGFGYYSLASILVTETGNTELASITMIANMLREIFTIAFAYFFVKYFGKLSPIMVAGAAAMDTCLPMIAKESGEKYALIGIFSGVVLTIVVPFLLPALLLLLDK